MALRLTKIQLQDRINYLEQYIAELEKLALNLVWEANTIDGCGLQNDLWDAAEEVENFINERNKH